MTKQRLIGKLANLKIAIVKHATFSLFFILPQRLTSTFVGLSLLSLMYQLRNQSLDKDEPRIERINQLLNVHVDEGILILPKKTLTWYWGNEVINSKLTTVRGRQLTVREILLNNDTLTRNRTMVVNHLLGSLPPAIQIKLKLNNPQNRIKIKHTMMGVLLTQPAM